MEHPQQVETACPDKSTLRAWEDMHSQILHDLQDGAEIPDSLIDSIAELVVMLRSSRSVKGSSLLKPSSPRQHA